MPIRRGTHPRVTSLRPTLEYALADHGTTCAQLRADGRQSRSYLVANSVRTKSPFLDLRGGQPGNVQWPILVNPGIMLTPNRRTLANLRGVENAGLAEPAFSVRNLADAHCWICLDVLLSSTSLVGHCACLKVNVVACDPSSPGGVQELREGAFARLIDTESLDQGSFIESWHIDGTGDQRIALHDDRGDLCEEETLARRK